MLRIYSTAHWLQMTLGLGVGGQGSSMSPSPSPSPGDRTTLVTVDIVVLVVYFLLVLAVGFWVSTGERKQVAALKHQINFCQTSVSALFRRIF